MASNHSLGPALKLMRHACMSNGRVAEWHMLTLEGATLVSSQGVQVRKLQEKDPPFSPDLMS